MGRKASPIRQPEKGRVLPGLTDSHFHSTAMAAQGLDVPDLLREFRTASAGLLLDVAIRPEDLPKQRALSGAVDNIYYSSGLHPSELGTESWRESITRVEETIRARDPRLRAVGETGLDWFRMYAARERQIESFDAHLSLASTHRLPIIVHNREADPDILERIARAKLSVPGIMHCFSSGPETARAALDAGCYLSFAGNVTFKNAHETQDAAKLVPSDRLLVETDAPFLTPHPYRGRPNHPAMAGYTLQALAELRSEPAEELAYTMNQNLRRVLQLSAD